MKYPIFTPEELRHIEQVTGFFPAGFFQNHGSLGEKYAAGLSNYYANVPLPEYTGTRLYPACDPTVFAPVPGWKRVHSRTESRKSDLSGSALSVAEKVSSFAKNYPKHMGNRHSNPNYERILSQGYESYRHRINHLMMASTCNPKSGEMYQALLALINGLETFAARIADYLGSLHFHEPEKERNKSVLAQAFSVIPMRPANSFAQAIIGTNLLFYLDGGDNLGRVDRYLYPFYQTDIDRGVPVRDEAKLWLTSLWDSVERLNGWNVCIGGSDADGNDQSNDLTSMCIETSKGRRRPNLTLKIHDATPKRIWDEALDCVSGGSGLPAFYGEKNILQGLKNQGVNISYEDVSRLTFLGCTETGIDGCSNIGTNDYIFNTLKLLEQLIYGELANCATFEEFYRKYQLAVASEIQCISKIVNDYQRSDATFHPALMRTLTIDDCIDNGEWYYERGARYTWSLITIAALANTVDSLYAIKKIVFDDRKITACQLCDILRRDYVGWESLLAEINEMSKFGNDVEDVDCYASELSCLAANEFRKYTTYRGGPFMCFCNTYWRFDHFGKDIGATPDGRRAYTPIADSASAVAGRDRKGPTALIKSVASLDQLNYPGTLVFNIRFAPDFIKNNGKTIRDLLETFFKLGGTQIQINTVDQKVLEDAMAHPENHNGLIVRVAGYSEYFNRLSPEIRQSVLERTAHT